MIFSSLFPLFSPVLFFFLFSSFHFLLTRCKKGEETDFCGFLLSCSLDSQFFLSFIMLPPTPWLFSSQDASAQTPVKSWMRDKTHPPSLSGPLFSTSIIQKALLKNWNNKGITEQGRKLFVSWEVKVKVTQSYLTLWPRGLYRPWNSPGQNTGVGSFPLLQR